MAVLVLVSLVLITIDFRSGEDGPLSGLRSAATTVLTPVQDGLATLVRPLGDAAGSIGDLFDLREENARLAARLEQLEERRKSFVDLERENAELRSLLGMRDRGQLDVVAGRTVALAPSNYEWTITLDIGAADGVARDMPVINGEGLVGRVVQVSEGASRVLLAIDPNFKAAARVARLGETGSIEGQGGDLMLLRPLDPEATIEVGDEVSTSMYDGGIFPPGIPIGTVEEVGEATTLLNRDVLVRPYVDFTSLDHVLVVRSAPAEGLPPLEQDPLGPLDVPLFPTEPVGGGSPSPTPSPTGTGGDG